MVINSLTNSKVKQAAALNQKKYRDASGLFLMEGLRIVCDTIIQSPQIIKELYITEDSLQAFTARLGDKYAQISDVVQLVSTQALSKLSDTVTSQQIIAVAKKPAECDLSSMGNRILFVDSVSDPGNMGTIIRTALAAGYSIAIHNCTDMFNSKTVRSSMGGIASIRYSTDPHILRAIKLDGFKILGADMGGTDIFTVKGSDKLCVVVGGEANGISEATRELCDELVSIPMESGIESLNVAVSAGIMMYRFR